MLPDEALHVVEHVPAEPGYAVIDLYNDGTAERSFQIYGWKPDAAK